jgi:tetratricopeptide (TPR) repeat protein
MIFVLFSLNCYAVDNLTAQQKEAKEWLEKAKDVDCIELKIEYYTKAIELCPKHIFANYIRGWAYSDLGEYQKAIDDYSKAIEQLDPKTNSVHKLLGSFLYYKRADAYGNLGEFQKAIDGFSKVIELDPKDVYAYFKRAIAYIDLGEYQKAIDDYTKTIKLNPEDANAYYNRGLTYVFREFPTAACGDFYQAGILYLKQNNKTQALICVDRMKKVDSSSPLINKLMDKIY